MLDDIKILSVYSRMNAVGGLPLKPMQMESIMEFLTKEK